MKCVECININRMSKASVLIELNKRLLVSNRAHYKLPLSLEEKQTLSVLLAHEAVIIENGESKCFAHSDLSVRIVGINLDE